jgi:hypothetical protein
MKNLKPFALLFLGIGTMLLPEKYFVIQIILAVICLIIAVLQTRSMLKSGQMTEKQMYMILLFVSVPAILGFLATFYL